MRKSKNTRQVTKEKEKRKVCPLCGGTFLKERKTLVLKGKVFGERVVKEVPVLKCERCQCQLLETETAKKLTRMLIKHLNSPHQHFSYTTGEPN